MTLPVYRTAERIAPDVGRRWRMATADRRTDAQPDAARTAEAAVGRTLEVMERRRLAAPELRILLALLDGEGADSELAEDFGRPSEEIRRTAERLYARGLLSWRHDPRCDAAVFGITRAGLATLRPLLAATSQTAQGMDGRL
jgi:hypothetical protein